MTGRYLMLDVAAHGMTGAVCGPGLSGTLPAAPVFAARDGLPGIPETGSWFQAALDAVADKLDLSGCTEAVVLISCMEVCFRNISLPFKSHAKIAQVLPFELGPHLPWDRSVSDFVSQDICFVQDQSLLLTASVSEALITEILDCLQARHIRPRVITPKGYAVAAAFMETRNAAPDLLFVHLDRAEVTLTLISGSKPLMVRSMPPSDGTGDTLVENIFRMITGFRHLSGRDTRFHICLAPEKGSLDPAVVMEKLTRAAASHTLFYADSKTVAVPDNASLTRQLVRKSGYGINFSKHAAGPGAFVRKFKGELLAAGVIGAMVFFLSVAGLYQNIWLLEKQTALARQTGAGLYEKTFPADPPPPGYAPLLLMQARVKQALPNNGTAAGHRDMPVLSGSRAIDVFYELSARIPADMRPKLSRLLLSQGQATLFGTTDSFNTVDRLKTVLEQSPLFKTVTITTADADKAGSQVIFQFRIDM